MIRITNNMIANTLKRNMNNNIKNLSVLQNQLSTGRVINRPSDNPAGLVRSLRLRSDLVSNDQYLANIQEGINYMDTTDAALDNLTKVLARVRDLTVQGANGTNDIGARDSIAKEVAQLRDQIKTVANTTYGSKYVFAGSNVTEEPCQGNQWTGNNQLLDREIGTGVLLPVNLNMKNWFVSDASTPASSVSGQNPSEDISAGPADSFQIQVDGDPTVRTVSLNLAGLTTGAAIATEMQTRINAIGTPDGYDYSSVSVSYDAVNKCYTIISSNTNLNAGVQITAAATNDVSAALKLGLANKGTETAGIFAVFDQVINALKNSDGVTASQLLTKLDDKRDELLASRAIIGAKTNRLEMQQSRLEGEQTSYTKLLAGNEDADMVEVGIQLKMQENVYNASLAGGAKIIQPSLIDFLK